MNDSAIAARNDEPDDLQLVAEARAGGKDAFATLYRRYATGVYRYVLLRVGNGDEAEDLTSTVFVRAWQSLPAFRQDCPFAAWLYRIARNSVTDYYRTRKQHLPLEQADEVAASDLTQSHEVAALHQAIGALPDEQREVLLLRFLEGFSHEEVAASLGKSVGACRVIQHRALKAVSRILGDRRD